MRGLSRLWRCLDKRFDDELLPVPDSFVCPISYEIMRDPVVTADGLSYERAAIEHWFSTGHRTSPRTNEPLPHQLPGDASFVDILEAFTRQDVMHSAVNVDGHRTASN